MPSYHPPHPHPHQYHQQQQHPSSATSQVNPPLPPNYPSSYFYPPVRKLGSGAYGTVYLSQTREPFQQQDSGAVSRDDGSGSSGNIDNIPQSSGGSYNTTTAAPNSNQATSGDSIWNRKRVQQQQQQQQQNGSPSNRVTVGSPEPTQQAHHHHHHTHTDASHQNGRNSTPDSSSSSSTPLRNKYPRYVALKHLDFQNARFAENTALIRKALSREIAILNMLSGEPYVMHLYDVFGDPQSDSHVYLVCEYCDQGSLSDMIKMQKVVPERSAKKILQQMAQGLYALYYNGVCHRDLKPANIFISTTSSEGMQVKIGDFGNSKQLQGADLTTTRAGTPLFMAPEVLISPYDGYDIKSDCFSVGVILYYMLTGGKYPYYQMGQSRDKFMNSIQNGPDARVDHIQCSTEAKELLKGLLQRDVKKRMSHEEFFRHPFINIRLGGQEGEEHSLGSNTARHEDLSFSVLEQNHAQEGTNSAREQPTHHQISLHNLFRRTSHSTFSFYPKENCVNFSHLPMNNSSMYQRKVIKEMENQAALGWIFAEYAAYILSYGNSMSALTGITHALQHLKQLNTRCYSQKQEINLFDSPRIAGIQEWIRNVIADLKVAAQLIMTDPKLNPTSGENQEDRMVSSIGELLFLYAKNLAHEATFNDCMNLSLDQIGPMYWRAELLFQYFSETLADVNPNDATRCQQIYQETRRVAKEFHKRQQRSAVGNDATTGV